MKLTKLLLISYLLILLACDGSNNKKVKTFKVEPEKFIDVSGRIVNVASDLYFKFGNFLLVDDLLIYIDVASTNQQPIHLFNRESLKYISSVGALGRGPGEITRIGSGAVDFKQKNIWVNDYGKNVHWEFPLDSIISNENFLPTNELPMNEDFFLKEFEFISDSIVLGVGIVPLSESSMEMAMSRQNFFTREINHFGYDPEKLNDRYDTYFSSCISTQGRFYVNCFDFRDRLIIADFEGNLIADVKGESFDIVGKRIRYFFGVDTYKNYIIASYIGGEYITESDQGGYIYKYPSKFLVFDSYGNFVKTFDVGSQFSSFIVDEKLSRVVLFFEDKEDSFGYFAIDDLLKY